MELLTIREAACRLRLTENTVYRLASRGELTAIRLGSGPRARLRIAESELERFLTKTEGGVAWQAGNPTGVVVAPQGAAPGNPTGQAA